MLRIREVRSLFPKSVRACLLPGRRSLRSQGHGSEHAHWRRHPARMAAAYDTPGREALLEGDSLHLIPGVLGPVPVESFVACWNHDITIPTKPNTSPTPPQKSLHSQWNAVAKSELLIRPESIATVTATSRNALKKEGLFLEGIALKRGSDAFTQVPDGIVIIRDDDSFQVKIANTTNRNLVVRGRRTHRPSTKGPECAQSSGAHDTARARRIRKANRLPCYVSTEPGHVDTTASRRPHAESGRPTTGP